MLCVYNCSHTPKKVKKKSTTAAAHTKVKNGNATNIKDSETENDETGARSEDSEDEENEEEDKKAEKQTTKKAQKVNAITSKPFFWFDDSVLFIFITL